MASPDNPRSDIGRLAIFLSLVLVVLLILDRSVQWILWSAPDESAWADAGFYGFAHSYRQALSESASPLPADQEVHQPAPSFCSQKPRRIVVIGSSVSIYGLQRSELMRQFEARYASCAPESLDVEADSARPTSWVFLEHPGLSTYHLRAYVPLLKELHPDLIAYPFGLVDFRLERRLALKAPYFGELEQKKEQHAILLADRLSEEMIRIAPGGLDPWQHLPDYPWARIQFARVLETSRYGSLSLQGWKTYLGNHLGSGRSYEHYAGVPVDGGGIHRNGWTGADFSVPWTDVLQQDGLSLEWQPPSTEPGHSSDREPNRSALLRIAANGCEETIELKPGWQRIHPHCKADELHFSLSTCRYDPSLDDCVGVRLSRNAGQADFATRSRPLRREDQMIAEMSRAQYLDSLKQRVLDPSRPQTGYFRAMESSRKDLAHRPFDATFPGFEMLRQSADELRAAGLEFLPVYMPELSYSREMYADSDFYAGFVEYLTQIGYLDCSAILPYYRFYDFHHLTSR